jgi:hypothetical protein
MLAGVRSKGKKKQMTGGINRTERLTSIQEFWANDNVTAVNNIIFAGFREANNKIQVCIR